MKSYQSDIADHISQIDMSTVTAITHEVCIYIYHVCKHLIVL